MSSSSVSRRHKKREDDVLGNGRYWAPRRSEQVMSLRRESVEAQSLQASQEKTAHNEGRKLVLYQYSFSDHVGFNLVQTAATAVWIRLISELSLGRCLDTGFCFVRLLCVW